MTEPETRDGGPRSHRGIALGAATVAAVGAAAAIYLASEAGTSTRRRLRRELDLDDRLAAMRDRFSPEPRRPVGLWLALGLAGAVTAVALLTPSEQRRRTKAWLGDRLEKLRGNASTSWKEHRAGTRHRMTPTTAEAVRRLEEGVEP